jgi:hypothetical protein
VYAEKNQISRTQFRAKSGAAFAFKAKEETGEIEGVPAAAKTQTTVAGTGDKMCCEPLDGVASSGREWDVEVALQQAIVPPQWQCRAAGRSTTGVDTASAWAQTSSRPHAMANTIFMTYLSAQGKFPASGILPITAQILAGRQRPGFF